MTEKKVAPKKKPAAKKAVAKKTPAKKAAPKTTNEVKEPVDTAPYLSKSKGNDENESSNYIVPAILILALSIVIVATFYADQFNGLVAKLTPASDTQETVIASADADTTLTEEVATQTSVSSPEETAIAATDTASAATDTASTATDTATAATTDTTISAPAATASGDAQTVESTGSNTAANTPSMAPAPYNVRPSWAVANTPYDNNMNSTQSKSYSDMRAKQKEAYDQAMQKHQEMMMEANELRKSAYDRMQKHRQEMQLKMEEMRQKSMKIKYEMDQKMKDAYQQYHAI